MAMKDLVKWVRLKLDKSSAQQTEDDAKKNLKGVDGAMGKLRESAKKLGAAIAAAFAVKKVLDFAKAAVAAARESERVYADLANTVDATGESYKALEADILASANAFEAATIHDDGDYAKGLQRMIALTGDTRASMNNMGLAADVAARFFDGKLEPAVELVGKAMNGNTAALQKMGLAANSAQEALDLLASRSMGAAAARAETLDGRIAQLNNGWGNFQKEVGFAITQSEGAGMAVQALGAAVQFLRDWVAENTDTIKTWVTTGVKFAIDAADALLRTLLGLGSFIKGGLQGALAAGAIAVSWLARGYALAYEAAARFLSFIGKAEWSDSLKDSAQWMREQADALRDWAIAAAEAGKGSLASGAEQFQRRLFSSDDFTGASAGAGPRVGGDTPMVGRNAKTDETEAAAERIESQTDRIQKALERFGNTMATNRTLAELMGDDFDSLASEAKALEAAIVALAEEGLEPNDELLTMMRDRLREVRGEMEQMEVATRLEEDAMRSQAMAAGELASALGAAMAGGLGPFAKGKARQNALEAAELTLRAIASALTGFGAARAGAFSGLAAKHAALAGAWGILGANVGGGSGSGGIPAMGGGGGGLSPTAARTTSSSSASNARAMGGDVQIHLVGPGFDALNPEVQRIVRGAVQESTERYGNARVRVIRRNS